MSSSLMASSQLDSVFLEGHNSYEVRQGLPEHRVLSTGSFFPRWYYSWFKNFSRMFPDHLDDCGLELASAVGKQIVNDNLIHALAERWNPSTSTFWFPWGEVTLLMDEFSEIMGLPEPVSQPGDPLEKQFLINVKGLDPRDALARMTGRKSWPLIEEDGNEYVDLLEIYKQYGTFVEVSSLSRTARERIQHAMVLCTVGLALFPDGRNYMDIRIVQLLRRWGSRQTSRLSIAMAALAFLYRGLTRFTLGESILVEGCTYALQSWFLRHVPARASSFRYNGEKLLPVARYRFLIDNLQEEEVVWDYFDRQESPPRYTYAYGKRFRLLGPFFCAYYHPERCVRQFSQRQKRVEIHPLSGVLPEFDLTSDQWSGAYHSARHGWDSFVTLTIFPGPRVSSDYQEWWKIVCPPPLCQVYY